MEISQVSTTAYPSELARSQAARGASGKPASSPEGGATALASPDDAVETDPEGASAPATASDKGLKSYTYGALGIDRPEEQSASQEHYYNAGQWTGAALKIGGIIALFA